MTAYEIGHRLAALGQKEEACKAYTMALSSDLEPIQILEAAVYILQSGGDYRIAYTCFHDLYNQGYFREQILPIMLQIFYAPNEKTMRNRYERNCRLLKQYPWCFREDFIPFDDLPIRFFPFNEHNGYVPLDIRENQFGDFVNFRDKVVSRNFFKDLEKPILAADVYSQYELEYLNDNVRRSEDIARENHLYLHYTSWADFCSYLQVLNIRPLVTAKKAVFLFEDEISRYPIDFKAEYGLDYSKNTVKPIGIADVSRLIWHTQLATHNGGDFFNEIFDAHPNLIAMPSVMLYSIQEELKKLRDALSKAGSLSQAMEIFQEWKNPRLVEELYHMRDPSDKDLLVAMYLRDTSWNQYLDHGSRICPALFFQPHFHNVVFDVRVNQRGEAVLDSKVTKELHEAELFRGFKYMKTFTPIRRPTVSHGATVRFMYQSALEAEDKDSSTKTVVSDAISERVLNRSFMYNKDDPLYHDSILVRFEDGKLNGKATFTALAAFLDLPYTESMTYCSEKGVRDIDHEGNVVGFDPATVYRTYDDYVNDSERYFIEYFLRDVYEYCGYDFQYYDGATVDEAKIRELTSNFERMDHYMRETWSKVFQTAKIQRNGAPADKKLEEQVQQKLLDDHMKKYAANRIHTAQALLRGLRFVNRKGQPLYMTPLLKLDPALLENPIYH